MKQIIIRTALAGLTAVTMLLSSTPTFAASSTVYVDDDKQQCPTAKYTSIQAAVDAVKPDGTIYVCSGAYNGQVTITKPLTLRSNVSNGQALPLLANFNGNTNTIIVQNTKNVTIRDLRIAGMVGLAGSEFNNGVTVKNADTVKIQHMTFSNLGRAVHFDTGSDNGLVQDSTMIEVGLGVLANNNNGTQITGNTITGIQQVFSSTMGTQLLFAKNVQFTKNNVTAMTTGVFVDESSAVVDNNVIKSSTYRGISLIIDSKVTISNNTVKDSKDIGIEVRESGGVTLKGNKVQGSSTLDVTDSTQDTKTAGTANTWTNNTCSKSKPKGLCK